MIALAEARHPHTRRLFERSGLAQGDSPRWRDLAQLPVTRKADYMRDPAAFRLDTARPVPRRCRSVWDMMYTTGSTAGSADAVRLHHLRFFPHPRGEPQHAAPARARPDDIIANLFPLTARPHGAFIRALHAAASMSLRVVSALPGNPSP